jgi:hypothetical protein
MDEVETYFQEEAKASGSAGPVSLKMVIAENVEQAQL